MVNLHHIHVLALAWTWMKCNRFNCMESVESMGCWLPGSWCLLVITPMGLDVIQSIQLYGIDGDPCLWLGYDALGQMSLDQSDYTLTLTLSWEWM